MSNDLLPVAAGYEAFLSELKQSWGAQVIDRLAADLRRASPI